MERPVLGRELKNTGSIILFANSSIIIIRILDYMHADHTYQITYNTCAKGTIFDIVQ
jgi:hypothetical protein